MKSTGYYLFSFPTSFKLRQAKLVEKLECAYADLQAQLYKDSSPSLRLSCKMTRLSNHKLGGHNDKGFRNSYLRCVH